MQHDHYQGDKTVLPVNGTATENHTPNHTHAQENETQTNTDVTADTQPTNTNINADTEPSNTDAKEPITSNNDDSQPKATEENSDSNVIEKDTETKEALEPVSEVEKQDAATLDQSTSNTNVTEVTKESIVTPEGKLASDL